MNDPVLATLADRIRSAQADGTPLRLRGGGSKDFYGERLEGVVLETRELRGVCSYEPSELVVTVRAGTPLTELEALLAGAGQYLPFEPPHFGPEATVGGMVAAGLCGPARAACGGVREHVLGVQLLNGRGQLLRFGGQVMKNVAGYDISRLLVGSLGTLGMVTEVSLKVLPRPVAEATLRFDCVQQDALLRLQRWAAQPWPLNASCWLQEGGQGRLILRLRGAQAAVQAACREFGGEQVASDAAEPFWHSLREQRHPFFAGRGPACLWRVAVLDTAPVLPFDAADTLVEWGGAQRWVFAPASAAQRLRQCAAAAGGHATLFRRGDALDAASWPPFLSQRSDAVLRIERALRRQFDPAGVFSHARMDAAL